MGFDLESFRANFRDGARGYLFYIKPSFPLAIGADANRAVYLVRSGSLPTTTLEEVLVPWQGYDYKLAGKYTFEDWAVTFNCDAEADIHTWYLDWMRLIHDPTSNVHSSPSAYMVDQQVELLGRDGEPVLKYKVVQAWPATVSAMELAYDSTDVAQFEVTFKYMYHVVDKLSGKYAFTPSFAG